MLPWSKKHRLRPTALQKKQRRSSSCCLSSRSAQTHPRAVRCQCLYQALRVPWHPSPGRWWQGYQMRFKAMPRSRLKVGRSSDVQPFAKHERSDDARYHRLPAWGADLLHRNDLCSRDPWMGRFDTATACLARASWDHQSAGMVIPRSICRANSVCAQARQRRGAPSSW